MTTTNQHERLGPAERIIQTLLQYTDHAHHGRQGFVRPAANAIGAEWQWAKYKLVEGKKIVSTVSKVGRREVLQVVGELREDDTIVDARGIVAGRYQPAGLFPEAATWMYRQVAEVWKLDNEFAARWASYAFSQEHRDLKVVLAAFMLVQSRKGDPQRVDDKIAFHDEDFRAVGEAMCLLQQKDKDLSPKLLLRIHELLTLPTIAAINRELGFTLSARTPFLGRWPKAVERWLAFREENPALLRGLVKAGFKDTVRALAGRIGYKPSTPAFFDILRWKQKQAPDGRRTLAIGKAVASAETWQGLSEREICERIQKNKPNWKQITGMVPPETGLTRAIVAAAVEARALSDKDLIIATPTLEDLGLLQIQSVKERWEAALKRAEDMRAANIAKNTRAKETKDKLTAAAEQAAQKQVAQALDDRPMRIFVLVDVSGSMEGAIEQAKVILTKLLPAFPPDRLHVAVFNTVGREIRIPHASAEGVNNAFCGITASGGTSHKQGLQVLSKYRPKDDEDLIVIVVGDEDEDGDFSVDWRRFGYPPKAFGLVKVVGRLSRPNGHVQRTAAMLGVPCFPLEPKMFDDVYAIPRTIRNLIAATPVGLAGAYHPAVQRRTLIDTILDTELLKKPVWAIPLPTPPKAKTSHVARSEQSTSVPLI